jgi:hypothetical protein
VKLTSPLVISFYSSTIFERVLGDANKALFASLGYGAIQVVFTIPTLFLIDTKGRRTLCLIVSHRILVRVMTAELTIILQTFPLMAIFLLAAGLSLLVPDTASQGAQLGPVVL